MQQPVDEKEANTVQIPMEIEIDPIISNNNTATPVRTQEKTKKEQQKASYKETVINLFKAFVGSGVIAMPYAFVEGGYLLSTVIFTLIAILVNYSQIIVIRLQEACPKVDGGYSDMVEHALGRRGVLVCRFFIITMQWGCCISYVIFFMRFFEYAFYQSDKPPIQRQLIYLAFAMCIIIPMTLINNMAVFVKVSALANALIIMTLAYLLTYAAYYIYTQTPEYLEARYNVYNFSRAPTVIGVAIYAFEAVGVLLTVKTSMKKQEKFKRLMQIVTVGAVCLNIVFSIVSSLGYGSRTNQIVLFSLPQDRIDVAFVQICYAVALAMSFPLQILPAFQLVERIQIVTNYIKPDQPRYLMRRTFVRVIQVLIICFIALGIPEFAVFLSFVGGMGGSALQFLFPLLAYFSLLWPREGKSDRLLFTTSMTIGVILGIYAMIASFIELVSY